MPLPVRKLGAMGLSAPAQGFGCMGLSAFYTKADQPPPSDENGIAVIRKAIELGANFLDTSDVYGPFTNEVLVGKAIAGMRERVVLATKCGIVFGPEGVGLDGSRQHVRAALEGSLQRLGVDCIDLYYLHRVDPKTPVEETFQEFKALVAEGKVRHVGISEASPEDVRRAHTVCPLAVYQLEWSLFSRDAERDLVPLLRELGIGIVAYSPLGRGLLTGVLTKPSDLAAGDFRLSVPRFQGEAMEKNLAAVEVVKKVAERHGATPAQVALAWVHAQGEDVFPIPGTSRIKYLEQNVAAMDVALTERDMQELDAVEQMVHGERYSQEWMASFTYNYGQAAAAGAQ